MKTLDKTIMSLGLSMLVGTAAFAQTTDQEKDKKDKDHKYQSHDQTSQMQTQQSPQDFTNYDSNQDGKLDEGEFVVVYTEVYTLDTTRNNQNQSEWSGQEGTSQEGTSTQQEGVAGEYSTDTQTSDQYGTENQTANTYGTQDQEMISAQFDNIDEDSDGFIDEQEFESWKDNSGTK